MYVYVCVCERENDWEKEWLRERESEGEREGGRERVREWLRERVSESDEIERMKVSKRESKRVGE